MVERIFRLIHREIRGIHEAAYLLGLFALLSQILALVRDRLLAHLFCASVSLDVYYAAFRIPDLIFVAIASFVSAYVLIPFFTEYAAESSARAKAFLDTVFSYFFLVMTLGSAAAFFLTPQILSFFFPTLYASPLGHEFVLLSRMLLLQPILLGISSLFSTVTQVYQKFILYAISPVLYNVGIILGAVFFYPLWGIVGLGVGVVLGAALHVGIQTPFVVSGGFSPRFRFKIPFSEIRRVLALSLPRTLGLSANQLSLFALIAFAAVLGEGAISVFNLSFNLQAVPLAIVGVSYSVAAFPTLARLFSSGKREEFFGHMVTAARHIIFWSLPIAALFIVLRAQIVRVILGSGAFDWSDTRLTAAALALFSVSLMAQGIVLLFARGYFAAGNTVKPLLVNVLSAFLAVGGSYILVHLFQSNASWRLFVESVLRVEHIEGTVALMLPLGYSLASLVNAFVLYLFFRFDFKDFPSGLAATFFQSIVGALAMGVTAYACLNVFNKIFDIDTVLGIFAQGLFAGLLGILSGVLLLRLLESRELSEISSALHRKFWKTQTVLPDQEL